MVLLDGEVAVVGEYDGVTATRWVAPGELFGTISSIDGLPRHDGALTRTEVEVVAIDPLWFDLLLIEVEGLGLEVLRDLTRRVRRLSDRIVSPTSPVAAIVR
jgi:CRP-like cAMP-binding protein